MAEKHGSKWAGKDCLVLGPSVGKAIHIVQRDGSPTDHLVEMNFRGFETPIYPRNSSIPAGAATHSRHCP